MDTRIVYRQTPMFEITREHRSSVRLIRQTSSDCRLQPAPPLQPTPSTAGCSLVCKTICRSFIYTWASLLHHHMTCSKRPQNYCRTVVGNPIPISEIRVPHHFVDGILDLVASSWKSLIDGYEEVPTSCSCPWPSLDAVVGTVKTCLRSPSSSCVSCQAPAL